MRTQLRLETMESRLTPSVTVPHLGAPSPALALHNPLAGWLAGRATQPETFIADVGTMYLLDGTAQLAGLGHVQVTGQVHTTGFVLNGHATGQLKLTKIGDSRSTLTIDLSSPQQPGFAPLPKTWTAHISGGTGAFKNIRANAAFTLSVDISNSTYPAHGTFHAQMK